MYKDCKTAQSSERQNFIGHTLLNCMKKEPYEKITVSDLCRLSNTPRNVFYRYFDCKRDVLLFAIDHLVFEYTTFELNHDIPEPRSLKHDLVLNFEFWYANRDIFDLFLKNDLTSLLMERILSIGYKENFGKALIIGDNPYDDNTGLLLKFASYGLFALLSSWHDENYVTPIDTMADIAMRLLTKPLYKPKV